MGAELMFVIGLTLLLIVAFKQDELSLDVHTTIGWVITFTFAFGWLRMIQLFFVRKLNQLSKKVQPKTKEGRENVKTNGDKMSNVPEFADYVKGSPNKKKYGMTGKGKTVQQDEQSKIHAASLSESSSENMSDVNESSLSKDSIDAPSQARPRTSQLKKVIKKKPVKKQKKVESSSESSINDNYSFDSNSEQSFDNDLDNSSDSSDSSDAKQPRLIGQQTHGAYDKNVLQKKSSSRPASGQIRISSSHSRRSNNSAKAVAAQQLQGSSRRIR